ncbi:hypothetical protein RDV84_10025 [Lysobacter yananisis]|uniref:Magnesium transporter MgtE intracellular domain-containing protein n=1 Tax=Lysobacter yananisis TaxID=1003114 RepID=A0ABY9PH30_9GAMM|nr:hypothetical protein [Lysobacter yananisis]WMT05157.1 hypothetical protein RDV84_10025 [Lysobacter yananisis]
MSGLETIRPDGARGKSERELRRTVGRLSQCSIEDIEAIWSQLDPREQAQLRPLLAEASGSLPESALGALPAVSQAAAEAAPASLPPAFGHYLAQLPETVAASVLASLDASAREAALQALPDPARRESLRAAAAPLRLRPAARRALHDAALAAAREVAPAPIQAPAETAPRGLSRLWRRSARA